MTGLLLDYGQLGTIILGASGDGAQCGFSFEVDDAPVARRTPRFRAEYENLLTGLLLLGDAQAIVEPQEASELYADDLVLDGFLEVVALDASAEIRDEFTRPYEAAYDKVRAIEANPIFASEISIDDPSTGWSESDKIDWVTDIEDAIFYRDALMHKISEHLDQIDSVFEDKLDRNWNLQNEMLAGLGALALGTSSFQQFVDISDTLDGMDALVAAMGLTATERHPWDPIKYPSNYLPTDMLNARMLMSSLWGIDEPEKTMPGDMTDWEAFASFAMSMNYRENPAEFLAVQAFWITVFELLGQLDWSAKTGRSLMVSSKCEPLQKSVPSDEAGQMVQLYRAFLTEAGMIPQPTTYQQLLKLREDPALRSLREVIATWMNEPLDGLARVRALRRDMDLAARDAKRARVAQITGRAITYLSLPVAVRDAVEGSALGLQLAAAGVAVEAGASRLQHRSRWFSFSENRLRRR